MENKKSGFENQNSIVTTLGSNSETSVKHPHQHNTAPQHRLIQYGLKIPNHQHHPVNQSPGFHPLSSPLHNHVHPPNQQFQYQQSHRHLQPSPQYNNGNIPPNFSLPLLQKYVHPHQKFNNQQNQGIYQTNPSTISNQSMNQNSPQIWVPYQPPPIHYHQKQTFQKNDTQKLTQATTSSEQSKPKETVERKKSSGGTIHIRSPAAKRPPEAPVTMQGWLHKQGSEGLMLWKKRWFVLSEYCLFYYKGIEEDKLLGSILLPSYRVSICKPEEKLSKKFCFKCEHVNMRTYILAAESQELMMQWVRVLSLASMMQTPSDNNQSSRTIDSSLRTIQNQSFDTSEISSNQYSLKQNLSTMPLSQSPSNWANEADAEASSNQSQQDQSQCNQPLYANAPPKPRRLNDGFSSPSPDLIDRYVKSNEPTYDSRSVAKSPSIYGHSGTYRNVQTEYYHHYQHCPNDYGSCMFTPTRDMNIVSNAERRTPDTYGRSKPHTGDFQRPTDYEDIYDEQSRYKRPLSPVAYSHVIRRSNNPPTVTPVYRAYTPVDMIGPVEHSHYIPPQCRKMPASVITRPHSADFLEYEMNRQPNSLATTQQPRPKSSLDINRNVHDSDNYFYSEEQYANKMRKSAQYLQKMPNKIQGLPNEFNTKTAPIRRYQENENTFPLMRSSTQPIHINTSCMSVETRDCQPNRSRSVLSEGSLSKELDMELSESDNLARGNTPDYASREMFGSSNPNMKNREYDPFIRSASARLAQNSPQPMYHHLVDDKYLSGEGERKREESMRRLLEWKQRMLQSPLNRKLQQGNKPNHLKHQENYPINDNGSYIMHQQNYVRRGPDAQIKEGQPQNTSQYTSYSSDDEEIEERGEDNVQSQAGRTLDTFSSKTESPTMAQIPPNTTVDNTFKDPDKPFTCIKHFHDAANYSVACEKHSDEEPEGYTDDTFSKPLQQLNREASHVAQVSSLRSEFSDKFEPSPIVTETKSNGASVKKILAEIEDKASDETEQPSSELENAIANDIIEENYMPMTPKKSILAPRSSITSDTTIFLNDLDSEENHYVEMTQNTGSSLLDGKGNNGANENQPYEMICFTGGKMEPVYMELKNPEQNTRELPDILMASNKTENHSNKSDSSDADDEASKDLDSLDTPSQPRFSLSDNFRPASYYLGATRTGPEPHDSSDSELVSPPPIPPYPPPILNIPSTDDTVFCLSKIIEAKKTEDPRNSDQFYSIQNDDIKVSNCSENETDKEISSKRIYFTEKSKTDKHIPNQNIDSDVEICFGSSSSYSAGYMMKRRPVSEEFCSELISLDGMMLDEFNQGTDLERYINELPTCSTSNDEANITTRVAMVSTLTTNPSYEYENVVMRDYPNEMELSKFSGVEDEIITKELNTAHIFTIQPNLSKSIASSLMQNSNCTTPVVDMDFLIDDNKDISVSMYVAEHRDQSFSPVPAPYYYSDLSISSVSKNSTGLTLNNQRESNIGSKKDITHIINPIKCNTLIRNESNDSSLENTYKLAAEARSASVDFLNLTDKTGSIDEKNIYESNTLKWQKTDRINTSFPFDPTARNLYHTRYSDKFSASDSVSIDTVRRSHSLEGFLENVTNQTPDPSETGDEQEINLEAFSTNFEGSYVWEEDSVWRERLRTASQRHTKSMDDLETIDSENRKKKKHSRGLTRGVTYVNDNFLKHDKQPKELENEKTLKSYNDKKEGNFIIDREKLRQWDLLSSAPSDDQLSTITALQANEGSNIVVQVGEGNCESPDIAESQETASGSVSINTRDMSRINTTFPRAISAKKVWATHMDPRTLPNTYRTIEKDHCGVQSSQSFYMSRTPSHPELDPQARKENWPLNDKMNVSAGELLGRTHEELVLLLIQLRRRSSQTLQAVENCYNDIDKIQANLPTITDQARRTENLQKLDQIKKHLLELEKQYEKGKPLVNLVDNMVKLGSLYRVPTDRNGYSTNLRDKLHFNQQIQERRLLTEEKRDWDRVNPDHFHFQEKVHQLYQLDRLIQEESGTLQNLQQDKEDIEQALGGLRRRLNKGLNDPAEIEHARQQQIMLENELSRVHLMLAQNSKKLEETVAGNARLEQELLVLKQKLQNSKQQRSSQQYSNAGDSLTCAMDNSVTLESELQKVQKKVGDLQKQRHELSMQVKQLTDRSSNLTQKSSISTQNSQWNKRKIPSLWRETDLDTMSIIDHGGSSDHSRNLNSSTSPLYVNTDIKQLGDSDYYSSRNLRSNDSTSDSTSVNSNLPHEKQEIKTVRIIKRESERRQRDREKSSTGRSEILLEEDDSSQCSSVLFRPAPVQKVQSAVSLAPSSYDTNERCELLNCVNSISSPNLPQCFDRELTSSEEVSTDKSPELSPVFKSEAARQIVTEVSDQETPKQYNRRTIPKEKRRHYTAPHNHLIMKSLSQLPTDDNNSIDRLVFNTRRARDDMDMERALRQRIDAPDVVRSTLSSKELKYNENTIDNILGTPNKINIPERYIPEQLPQLSVEEQEYRLKKVESIKKMLSETALISSSSSNVNTEDKEKDSNAIMNKTTTKMMEEKKQREHLLQLNQILAKQVMEMSKIVAGVNTSEEKS